MGLSAGHQHFRCPNCNDTSTFIQDMLLAGIYVPEQDASWEREAGGFEDLDVETPRVCHAKLCFCPHDNGRAYHSEDGLWEILKCDSCGYKVRLKIQHFSVTSWKIRGKTQWQLAVVVDLVVS